MPKKWSITSSISRFLASSGINVTFSNLNRRSTLVLTTFTFWPPGPELRLYVTSSSFNGMYPLNFSLFGGFEQHGTRISFMQASYKKKSYRIRCRNPQGTVWIKFVERQITRETSYWQQEIWCFHVTGETEDGTS